MAILVSASAVACGATSEPAPADADAGASDSALPETDSSTPHGEFDPLNGVDAGCIIKADGPRSGRTATSVSRASEDVGWNVPDNARSTDGLFAQVTLDDGQTSEQLRITGFGIRVPATAKIKGAVVELKRQASAPGIADGKIGLWLDGAPSDRPKFLSSPWPRTIIGTHHYGQAVDTWGNDLTPELVGRPGFGVDIYVRRETGEPAGPVNANVDSMLVTIYYCD